jgi:hypothetical protein
VLKVHKELQDIQVLKGQLDQQELKEPQVPKVI